MNKIIKTYEYFDNEEKLALYYEDISDAYIFEDSLGEIGMICISKGFNQILPSCYPTMEKYLEREVFLEKEFIKLFNEPLTIITETSEKYFEAVKKIILEEFGYTEEQTTVKTKKRNLPSSNR